MKKLNLFIMATILPMALACTRDNATLSEASPTAETLETAVGPSPQEAFMAFSTSLPELSLPFTAACSFTYVSATSLDTAATRTYLRPSELPYRKLPLNGNVTAVLVLFPTDEMLPRLRTFDRSGQVLDELDLKVNPCQTEPGIDHREQYTFRKDLTLQHLDSTYRWQFDANYTEIPKTRKLTVTRKNYRITSAGKIMEIK